MGIENLLIKAEEHGDLSHDEIQSLLSLGNPEDVKHLFEAACRVRKLSIRLSGAGKPGMEVQFFNLVSAVMRLLSDMVERVIKEIKRRTNGELGRVSGWNRRHDRPANANTQPSCR